MNEYAKSINERKDSTPPKPRPVKAIFAAVLLLLQAAAGAEFLEKVDSADFEVVSQPENPNPVICSEPAPHESYPEAALVSVLEIDGQSLSSELVWTLHMKNGDTIIVREQFVIHPLRSWSTAMRIRL